MLRKVLFLVIAVGLTIIATFIQQIFSSDSPNKYPIIINGNEYEFKLPVVHDGSEECLLELSIPDTTVTGSLYYKLHNSSNDWKTARFIRMPGSLVSVLPFQKPNIKLSYYIVLKSGNKEFPIAKAQPVVVRFQSVVPKLILFPQVALMFLALIVGCFAGLRAVFNIESYRKYANLSFYLFVGAAFVLGLVVHVISFGHVLVQISQHNDLTFYKNIIITLLWLGLFLYTRHHGVRYLILITSIITLILYCLPQHLLFGWIHF